jgi:hypothetical protein
MNSNSSLKSLTVGESPVCPIIPEGHNAIDLVVSKMNLR